MYLRDKYVNTGAEGKVYHQVGGDPKGGRKGVGKVAGEEEAARVWGSVGRIRK